MTLSSPWSKTFRSSGSGSALQSPRGGGFHTFSSRDCLGSVVLFLVIMSYKFDTSHPPSEVLLQLWAVFINSEPLKKLTRGATGTACGRDTQTST